MKHINIYTYITHICCEDILRPHKNKQTKIKQQQQNKKPTKAQTHIEMGKVDIHRLVMPGQARPVVREGKC